MKKIAILISGQIRNNSLNNGDNYIFENAFTEFILNKKTTDNYEINVFFVTDESNKEKVQNYFGSYLKGFTMQNHDNCNDILSFSECEKKYLEYYNYRKSNPDKFPIVTLPRISVIYIFYRLYFAYLMMIEYENKHGIKHDYIMRMRPDTCCVQNLYDLIKLLENDNKKQILLSWDHGFIGKYDIMVHICKLIFIYGKYNYGEIKHSEAISTIFNFSDINYLKLAEKLWKCWSESPEVQLFEHIINYIYNNNYDSEAIQRVNFVSVFR